MSSVDNTFMITRRKEYEVASGGAVWKIAYADFVTAMMAFFLLLWLTSIVSQEQAAGVSDYFAPPVDTVQSEMSEILEGQIFNSENVLLALRAAQNATVSTPQLGGERSGDKQGKERLDPEERDFSNADVTSLESSEASKLEDDGQKFGAQQSENPRLQSLRNSFTVEDTPLGIRVDLADGEGGIIFDGPTSAELTDQGKRFISKVFSLIVSLPNSIIIVGHAEDRSRLLAIDPNIDVWQLSLDRALSVRDWLEYLSFPEQRILRIDGRADSLNHRLQEPKSFALQNRVSLYLAVVDPAQPNDVAKPIFEFDPKDILINDDS